MYAACSWSPRGSLYGNSAPWAPPVTTKSNASTHRADGRVIHTPSRASYLRDRAGGIVGTPSARVKPTSGKTPLVRPFLRTLHGGPGMPRCGAEDPMV